MGLRGSDGKTASERQAAGNAGIGLSMPATMHGNTAYGPAGGYARGFATTSPNGTVGNWRSINNAPMSGPYGRVTGPAAPGRSPQPIGGGFVQYQGQALAPGGWTLGGMFGPPLQSAFGRFSGLLGNNPRKGRK